MQDVTCEWGWESTTAPKGGWIVACQLYSWGSEAKLVQATISQRWYHCQLCLGPVNVAVHAQSVVLDTLSLGFHQAPGLVGRASSCPSPWGRGKDALLRSTCHLLLSSRRLHKLHREGFIWEDEMDFAIQSSYRTNCVWACVFVHVFSDPLLLSDILFPLSIWQLRLYLPLGRLFSTQETSFTNKQHLGSIWEMLPFS